MTNSERLPGKERMTVTDTGSFTIGVGVLDDDDREAVASGFDLISLREPGRVVRISSA
jgi:hypothetical protein